MDHDLRRGDNGEKVKGLQTALNRVGAMLVPDGDFGWGTERGVVYAQNLAGQAATGVADVDLWAWLTMQDEPFKPLSTNGVAFIAREETGGIQYYNAVARWPHYPGVKSGITIGVGYDLRFHSEKEFRETWGKRFLHRGRHVHGESVLDELAKDIGKPGTKKRAAELKKMGIEVPFHSAWSVFVSETLPKFYDSTVSIYPSLPRLPDLCRAALVSIVFNRGPSLRGNGRIEMRKIAEILEKADNPALTKSGRRLVLSGVEEQIVSMQRLWGIQSGLRKRRQAEANLWREGVDTV